jgi:hypothetical protein
MFDNPNIVEKIKIDNSQFILKIKNPQFHIVYPSYTCESHPIVIKTERNPGDHVDKTVFVIPYHPKYFHNMMEVFPLVLTLINNVKDVDVFLTYEADIDKESGLFISMIDGYKQPDMIGHCPVDKYPQLFIAEFFKYFNINFTCINTKDLMYKSFDYCYLFYVKNESSNGKNFLYDEGKEFCKELENDDFHPLFVGEVNPLYRFIKNINLVKKYLPKHQVIKNQKIYISRKNFLNRKITDEDLLEEYFENKGYKVCYFEKMGFIEQIKIVQESEKVVCMFGSSLVNCMLASQSTSIISIKPKSFSADFYKTMFDMYNIEYSELDYDGDSVFDLVKSNEEIW